MEPDEERAAAELRRVNAEADKLVAEADKLEAEEQHLLRSVVKDVWMIGLAVFAAGLAALQFAEQVGSL
ncbi:MAG: hypothetical protein F4X99_16520 [Gammaproteobacteria bacterium]|nr:hypothetical protein [Gammaproteobacteria bacterium]